LCVISDDTWRGKGKRRSMGFLWGKLSWGTNPTSKGFWGKEKNSIVEPITGRNHQGKKGGGK